MITNWQFPIKEIDVDFLVFVERYATDLLRWDILTFFGHNPNLNGSVTQIAHHVGRSSHSIRAELGDLALLGVLEKVGPDGKEDINYRLTTQNIMFRQMAIKLASNELEGAAPGPD